MIKDFTKLMRQYAAPYKGHLAGAVVLNILSAVFNIFSFAILVPLLQILFKVNDKVYTFMPWESDESFKDIVTNNFYYYVSSYAQAHGVVPTLALLAGVMILFTILKTSCYFGSNAVMIPISTGIVKEIRCRIYDKILRLPLTPCRGARSGGQAMYDSSFYLHNVVAYKKCMKIKQLRGGMLSAWEPMQPKPLAKLRKLFLNRKFLPYFLSCKRKFVFLYAISVEQGPKASYRH